MVYTRYADDITISSSKEDKPKLISMKAKVNSIIDKFGWKISGSKVNLVSCNNPSEHQEVTGILISRDIGQKNLLKGYVYEEKTYADLRVLSTTLSVI